MSAKKIINRILKPILAPVIAIETFVKCTIKMIVNFPQCFIYYLLEIIGNVLYLPIMLIVWAFGMREIEISMWKMVRDFDNLVNSVAGFYLFKYSNSILNKCYRCKNKKAKSTDTSWLDKMVEDYNKDMTKMSFFSVMVFVILLTVVTYYLYYYLNVRGN
tara:strand:+ start:3030 stop:3509 length:480 start_codon:yes stop_codon:yes gene_type:complete